MEKKHLPFKLLISTANYLPVEDSGFALNLSRIVGKKFEEVIEEIKKDKFGVELWRNWPDKEVFDEKNWSRIKKQIADIKNITIHSECVNKGWNSIQKEIELSSFLNVQALVVHVLNFGVVEAENKLEIDENYFEKVLCQAEKNNVFLALENGRFDILQKFCKLFGNSNNLKICLDVGHANIPRASFLPEDCPDPLDIFIKEFKDKIIHFHIHDNFGKEDEHLIPGKGNIDWNKVIKHIESLKKNFTATLELRGNISDVKKANLQAMDFLNSFLKI